MKRLTKDNFNELEIGEIYTFNIFDNNKHMLKRVVELDANITCVITDVDILEKKVYFNIILTDNTNYWYTGPDEADINLWNIEFEKIQIEDKND
jgi:hypothetical protein